MSDIISVLDLEVYARIGVTDEERREPQRLLISMEMNVGSISHAAGTDNLARTVNYFEVVEFAKAIAAEKPRKLIEALIEKMAIEILKAFPIQSLTLEIKKFILPDAKHVSVKIVRARDAILGR